MGAVSGAANGLIPFVAMSRLFERLPAPKVLYHFMVYYSAKSLDRA